MTGRRTRIVEKLLIRAVEMVRKELGLQTVLGVSNISFGLPNRLLITNTFLARALSSGLTLPIVNPNQREILDTVYAFRASSTPNSTRARNVPMEAVSPS